MASKKPKFLPRDASAEHGECDATESRLSDVSVIPSVCLSVRDV